MRLYRALLHLLPASFRAEYGADMTADFARRRGKTVGLLARLALWLATIADLLGTAVLSHLDLTRQDLRYTARSLRRSPGFAFMAVVVSALGIGATTASFTTLDHVLIRPLPFADADRLVKVWQDESGRGYARLEPSPPNYRDWKRLNRSFEVMGAYQGRSVNLVGQGAPQRLESAAVTAELLPMLGRQPLLGRVFSAADDKEGAAGTLLLSHRLWQAQFAGDPGVVGRRLLLDGLSYLVIGVMPADFHFPRRETQLWTAMRFDQNDFSDRTNYSLYVLAKLRPSVSLAQARAEMAVIARQLERAHPVDNEQSGIAVVGLRDEVGRQSRLLLVALTGAALGLLLIACTNLAGLLLARALARRKDWPSAPPWARAASGWCGSC